MGTWTFSDDQFTATSYEQLKKRRSAIDSPLPVAKMLLDNKEDTEGGERAVVPWNYQRHSNTTRIVNGFEGIDLTGRPTLTHAHDDWCYVAAPSMISKYDQNINRGGRKMLDLAGERTTDTDRRLHRELELQVLKATQTAWADLNSWNGTDSATGFFEENAVGSQTNTVMNLSKGTYATLVGFQNQTADIGGSFSTVGLVRLRTAGISTRFLNQDDETKPHGFVSLAAAGNYLRAVQSNERYMKPGGDAAQIEKMVIMGLEFSLCDNLPNDGSTTGSNDDEWSFLVVDAAATRLLTQKGVVFDVSPWRDLGGAQMLVKVCLEEFMGQLVIDYFGSSMVIIGGDTW